MIIQQIFIQTCLIQKREEIKFSFVFFLKTLYYKFLILDNRDQIIQQMKRKNINKSQSTSDLYSQLIQAKDKKKVFLKELKTNIKNSQSLIKKSQSQASIKLQQKIKSNSKTQKQSKTKTAPPPRLLNKKQKSLEQLSRNLSDRISIDKFAKKKLEQLTQQQIQKKQQLQRRIEQIKRRNQFRMKQLQQFQNKYLKKLNQQYKKDKQKQQKLLIQYEGVLEQHGKIKETQNYRKAIESQDWHAILAQKNKLENMIRQFNKKQSMLLRDQNPETIKKIVQQNSSKIIIQQREIIPQVRKPRTKIDAKEIGNQYLQYAKKLKQQAKQKPKVKLFDINFKCIDYEGDIINKIARNTGDLSKLRKQVAMTTTVKEAKLTKQGSIKSNNSQLVQIKQDQETKKYLKQIRTNLKQLEKST